MAVSRLKTWVALEVVTASDLNAEFNNILTNGEDLAWPASKAKDMNGNELILDADADTSITADSDDIIDFRLRGQDLFKMDGATNGDTVNGLKFVGAATGSAASIEAQGDDTDISIDLVPKGTGSVNIGGSNIGQSDQLILGTQVFG